MLVNTVICNLFVPLFWNLLGYILIEAYSSEWQAILLSYDTDYGCYFDL